MTKKITRSTVNEQQYSALEFSKSGFPLSYRRYSSYMLGRLHVAGFHWTMPGDKISGRTSGQCTFKRIVTPLVSPVNAMQYNIFLPLRPLDRSFQKGITPTKMNAMSANWTMPLFNTRYLVDQILKAYVNVAYNYTVSAGDALMWIAEMVHDCQTSPSTTADVWCQNAASTPLNVSDLSALLYGSSGWKGFVNIIIESLTQDSTILCNMADDLYLRDALIDIADNITSKLGSKTNPLSGSITIGALVNLLLSTLLTPFIGRYSYYGEFKYEFLRPFDFYRIGFNLSKQISIVGWDDFLSLFSDTPQNEYAIRTI